MTPKRATRRVSLTLDASKVNVEGLAINIVKLLEEKHPQDPNSVARTLLRPTKSHRSLLHLSAMLGFHELLGSIVSHGVDLNQLDSSGYTALHYAALYGHNESAELLVRCGASVKIIDRLGRPPETIASDSGHHIIGGMLRDYQSNAAAAVPTLTRFAVAQAPQVRAYEIPPVNERAQFTHGSFMGDAPEYFKHQSRTERVTIIRNETTYESSPDPPGFTEPRFVNHHAVSMLPSTPSREEPPIIRLSHQPFSPSVPAPVFVSENAENAKPPAAVPWQGDWEGSNAEVPSRRSSPAAPRAYIQQEGPREIIRDREVRPARPSSGPSSRPLLTRTEDERRETLLSAPPFATREYGPTGWVSAARTDPPPGDAVPTLARSESSTPLPSHQESMLEQPARRPVAPFPPPHPVVGRYNEYERR